MQQALRLSATYLCRQIPPTAEPTKEKATIKMDGCIDSDRLVSSTNKKIHRNMKTVDSTSCWFALLYIIVSLFGFNPPITELLVGGSFDLHIWQQLVNSGNPLFQLEEPIRYNRFEWGRRFVPNASLSLVPSLSPSSNLSENPNGNLVLSPDPSFNPWDFSSSTQLPRDDDNDDDEDDDGNVNDGGDNNNDDDDDDDDNDDDGDNLIDVDDGDNLMRLQNFNLKDIEGMSKYELMCLQRVHRK